MDPDMIHQECDAVCIFYDGCEEWFIYGTSWCVYDYFCCSLVKNICKEGNRDLWGYHYDECSTCQEY
jgi:hypothetical protein